jgi:uncharacterized membrane protein
LNSTAAPVSVVAVYYADPPRASEALEILQNLRTRRAVEILDAAVMSRDVRSNRLQISETREPRVRKLAAAGGDTGGVLGVIFPPSVLALGAVGAAAGAALAHFRDQGFDNNLLKEIGENLPPGGAAVVAVIEETWLADLPESLAGYTDLERFARRPDFGMPTEGDKAS